MKTVTPQAKYTTPDNFIKWYDQKIFGTKQGSLGLKHSTVGKLMGFEDFKKTFTGFQSK
jgi:hypothetical protein